MSALHLTMLNKIPEGYIESLKNQKHDDLYTYYKTIRQTHYS